MAPSMTFSRVTFTIFFFRDRSTTEFSSSRISSLFFVLSLWNKRILIVIKLCSSPY
jgi:hypothetical protein